ncbi:hypothetical protein ACFSQ3_13855 [Sphingobacterium corticis]|uniref:Uncharacterized protein n=1 Tax=Sphingobacterium corticis TaxID=1812823 RepID=A0ABW5NLM7_9SPHI
MKKSLTAYEVSVVQEFIIKKGFKSKDMLHAIAERFVPLVEQARFNQPELPLEEAIRKAHASLGSAGFSSIEDAYQRDIQSQHWRNLKMDAKNYVLSIQGVLSFVGVMILAYYAFKHGNDDFLEGARYGMMIAICVAAVTTGLMYRPVSWRYTKYKSFLGFATVILSLLINLQVSINTTSLHVSLAWQCSLLVVIIYSTAIFIHVFNNGLKRVVVDVDELELNYAKA